MRFFIDNVTVYATAGKTRRGALLQAIANQFEHCILGDVATLDKLVERLEEAVRLANLGSKGKPLKLEHYRDYGHCGGQICVKPVSNANDNHVFTISYKPVAQTLFASNVSMEIAGSLAYNSLRQLADAAGKGGEL